MKTILYMAVSVNGHITKGSDDSDWVSEVDWTEFDRLKRECGVMVMGANTYIQFQDEFPQEGALNIVMTRDTTLLQKKIDNARFTSQTPEELMKTLEDEGFNQVMIIGGMKLNSSLMKARLIDEIWLSIHTLFIGTGKSLTEEIEITENLKYLGMKELDEGLVQLRYQVVK